MIRRAARRAFVAATTASLVATSAHAEDGPTPTIPPVEDIVVRGPHRKRDAVQVIIATDQAQLVPGTQGDALKVVQSLPGLARPTFGTGQLVVWGSAPKDTRVYVDGVEIPALYNGSGVRSTIQTGLVQGLQLVPGAFGAEYGRGLGGLVLVETRALRPEGVHGSVAVDPLDASAMTSAAFSPDARAAVAARYGYLDRALGAVSSRDIGDAFPIPKYRDYQAKGTLDLGAGESASIVFLGSGDDLRRAIPSPDPSRVRAETTSSTFHRLYVRYTRAQADGAAVEVTPFVGYDTSSLETSFGANPTRLDVKSTRYGIRASHRVRLVDDARAFAAAPPVSLTFATGVDVLGSFSKLGRAGTLTLPAREGDVTYFGQPPGDDYAVDDWSAHILDVGPYVAAEIEVARAITVTPGIRFDAFLIEGSRTTPRVGATPPIGFSRLEGSIDPRLALSWRVHPRVTVNAAVGMYHQAPEPEDLSAVFGTPALTLARARHATIGQSLRVTKMLTFDVVAFHKSLSDMPVRTRLTDPKLARTLVQDGEGRSYGVQLMLRQQLWKGFFGWVSYAIARSERRYFGDETWRLFDYDQPHVLAVVGSQKVDAWTFGARFRYATGAPRTPVTGALYDVRGDQYQPIFGAQNSIRIPDFYQLDLRADRRFRLGESATLDLYLDLQNVTFHTNREEIVYSADFSRKSYVTGLPFLALLGARLEL